MAEPKTGKAGNMAAKLHTKFVEFKPKDLSKYTLIEGFPGMGLVGTISAKYLIERMKFKLYGYIDSDIFIPVIRVHNGLPVNPSRIYVNDERKLAVLISEQIIPRRHTDYMAEQVVDWVRKKGIRKLISLSGIHAEDGAKGMVYGIASNDDSKKVLEKHKVEVIGDGITTGVTALILLKLKNSDIEACSIMGNVKIAADYEAAAELIKKLNEILELNIVVEPLLKEARETEKELMKQLERIQKTKDPAVERFESRTPMYT